MTAALAPLKRDRRREQTRNALINAGLRLFAERPVEGVTIDNLVQAANVAKGSFYNHFTDRDSLVLALANDIRSGIESLIAKANANIADPAERIVRAVCVYVRYAHDDPIRAAVLLRLDTDMSTAPSSFNQGILSDIAMGLANGRISAPTTEAGMLFVAGVARIATRKVIQLNDLAAAIHLSQPLIAMLLIGLGINRAEAEHLAVSGVDQIVHSGAFTLSYASPLN
jgi:AcrR family transcriptional regulator